MKPKNELSSLHLRTLIALHRLVPDFFANIFEYGSGPPRLARPPRPRPFLDFADIEIGGRHTAGRCQTSCQITKCGCKINDLTIFFCFPF